MKNYYLIIVKHKSKEDGLIEYIHGIYNDYEMAEDEYNEIVLNVEYDIWASVELEQSTINQKYSGIKLASKYFKK